jgi:hypothetical protein
MRELVDQGSRSAIAMLNLNLIFFLMLLVMQQVDILMGLRQTILLLFLELEKCDRSLKKFNFT